jgi:YD repeat-containing protein
MKCFACHAEIAPSIRFCPYCGLSLVDPAYQAASTEAARKRAPSRRFLRHLLIALGLVLLTSIPEIIHVLKLRLPLRTTPMVREAILRAQANPAVVQLLGLPFQEGVPRGYTRRDETGWGEALFWIPLRGTKTEGTLYVRAGKGDGPWIFSTLELRVPAQARTINLLEALTHQAVQPKADVYLVHLGGGETDPGQFIGYYRDKLQLDVKVLPPIVLTVAADPSRRQYAGEDLIRAMKASSPALAGNPRAVVIGIIEEDIYIRKLDWDYAFNYREGNFAIIGTARLQPLLSGRSSELLAMRTRKLITKNIGLLAYRLPLSSDPTSVLYGSIQSVKDLDLVREEFSGTQQLAVAEPMTTAHTQQATAPEMLRDPLRPQYDDRYPCLVVRHNRDRWLPGEITQCVPSVGIGQVFDQIEVDLRTGLFVLRKTDFVVEDQQPLALTRAYRQWDHASRAFGLGANHSFDTFPVGSRNPYTFIDVVLADGHRIHYDRISAGTGYADAVYRHLGTASEFAASEFKWNGKGWDLKLRDGSLYRFPESYNATTAAQGALIAMQDPAGKQIVFDRDGKRNLARVTGPGGAWMAFQYDAGGRITAASDNNGRIISYTYDIGDRLAGVYEGGRLLAQYSYDGHMMLTAGDMSGVQFTNRYNGEGRIEQIQLSDGQQYNFRYSSSAMKPRRVAQTLVTDSQHRSTEIRLNPGDVDLQD